MASAAQNAPAATVGDCESLLEALDRYCSIHLNFESSALGELVREDMGQATDINAAALVPLRHKILSFDDAVKWGLYLMLAVPHCLEKDNARLGADFDIVAFNQKLVAVYDIAVKDQLRDVFEEDDESDSEED